MNILRRLLRTHDASAIEPSSSAPPQEDANELAEPLEDRRRIRGIGVSVLQLEPQRTPGERVGWQEHEVVERVLMEQLRREDRYCATDDDSYVIVLAATADDQGRVVAQRLSTEVIHRVAFVKRRKWKGSVAPYPRDAKIQAALAQLSQNPPRRLGLR